MHEKDLNIFVIAYNISILGILSHKAETAPAISLRKMDKKTGSTFRETGKTVFHDAHEGFVETETSATQYHDAREQHKTGTTLRKGTKK